MVSKYEELLKELDKPFEFEEALNKYVENHCDLEKPLSNEDLNQLMVDFCNENRYQLQKLDNLTLNRVEMESFVTFHTTKSERTKSSYLSKKVIKS